MVRMSQIPQFNTCPICGSDHKDALKRLARTVARASANAQRLLVENRKAASSREQRCAAGSLRLATGYLDYVHSMAKFVVKNNFDLEAIAVKYRLLPDTPLSAEEAAKLVGSVCRILSRISLRAESQRACASGRIARRKAAGLCTDCGKRPALRGRIQCRRCLVATRERARARRSRATMEQAAQNVAWPVE
jgi:hypothetical protein